MNKTILLNSRPVGTPKLSDFKLVEKTVAKLSDGEVLLETKYISVDPYLRGRMNDQKLYIAPFQLNEPIQSGMIAEVITSKNENFKIGDFVSGMLNWQEYQISNGENLLKVDANKAKLSAYLGVLGMTGTTAYLGLLEIGKLKAGETIVVSGAAGAVGSVVGQIAKILGCRTVGIAGTQEKIDTLKNDYGFDEVINYKTTKNIKEAIAKACPNGVDVYWENVGGDISDAVHQNINKFGRIIVCGVISMYNKTKIPTGPRIERILITQSVLMQGFTVFNYIEKFPEAITQLTQWLNNGQLKHKETIIKGFENTPQAFLDLFEGKNNGKMIVEI